MATAATRVPSSKDQHIIQTPEGHEIVSVEGGMSSSDTARTADTPVLPVQHIDAAGNVGGVTDTPYAQKITEGSGVVYVAIAPIGTAQATAGWRAKKITVSGADTIITWAGSGAFNQVATDLTTLTYE